MRFEYSLIDLIKLSLQTNFLSRYSRDELKQLKREYWISFSDYCKTIPQLAMRKSKFMLYNTKLKGVELKFDATRNGAFVIMEINHTDPDRRFELFEHAQACRLLFEQELGNELIWELCYMRPEGKEVSRIYIQKMGMDLYWFGVMYIRMYKSIFNAYIVMH